MYYDAWWLAFENETRGPVLSFYRAALVAAVTGSLVLGIGVLTFWPAALSGLGTPIRHLAGIGNSHTTVTVTHTRIASVPVTAPGPNNTGWRHTGVHLTQAACGANGELLIDTDGATIDSALIQCNVRVNANNVTISRSLVAAGGPWAIYKPDAYTNLKVTDVEINGRPGCQAAIAFSHYTATRVNIHGCQDGVRIDADSTLQDSWIHNFWDGTQNGQRIDEPNHDGVSTTGGSNLTIRHNRIDNPHSNNSCIAIGGVYAEPSNVLIEDNYLDGGNYSVLLAPYGNNRVIKDNTFTRNFLTGPVNLAGSYAWSGNVYTDGSPVPG
jgi:hypothetical protein